MTATTMRFGPEWMRKQPAPAKLHATSPPPSGTPGGNANGGTPAPPGVASYSALVTPQIPSPQGKRDLAHPFKYSRDEILQVYKDLGDCSELPIEVECWEGIVRESAGEPVTLSDLSEVERKLYATSLNSEIRRRQPSDYAAQGDRSKGLTLNSGLGLMARRRRGDSNSADQPPLSLPRKTSWSGTSGNIASPTTASPRTRMGIDGMLNGNDAAWGVGKKRAASGQPLPGHLDEEAETQNNPHPSDPKESAYVHEKSDQEKDHVANEKVPLESQSSTTQDSGIDVDNATLSMTNLALNEGGGQSSNQTDLIGGSIAGPTDFAKVEWSYIDPSGLVQGPFSGELMQRWNDQSYFTDELLMKRTTLDAEFIPLSEIKRRMQGERIFLSPLSDFAPPPGLGNVVHGSGFNSLLQRTGVVDGPRQPSPQSYGRSNTLDSFNNTGPIATGSASPSSSFGGSLARGPLSPEPITVGSRLQRLASDAALNGRVSSAGSYSSNGSPAMPQAVRQIFNEPRQPNRSASLDAQAGVPWQIPEANGMQGWNGSSDVPHLAQPGRFEQMAPSLGHNQFMRDTSSYAGSSPVELFFSTSAPSHRFYDQPNTLGTPFQQMLHDPSRLDEVPRQPSLPQLNTSFDRGFEHQASSPSVASTGMSNYQYQRQVPLSPWGALPARQTSLPRPFDADLPTSNNTFVVSVSQTTARNRSQADARWTPTSQSLVQDNQRQLTEEPQCLSTANVTQHNERQSLLDARNPNGQYAAVAQADISAQVSIDAAITAASQLIESRASVAMTSVTDAPAQSPATKRKGSSAPAPPIPEAAAPANAAHITKVPGASSAPQKAAWATDDDGKSKPSMAPMTLRDIQEAEKKKQEARKMAGKERDRAARAASATSPAEEVQFTASWGLPTSQVGAKSNSTAASPATTISPPVWTNTAKPAAKTMKEIQEEEERRKKSAKEKETAATAAKRAAQAAPSKASVANAQSGGGAWNIVGSRGKVQTAASIVTARPTAVATPNVQAASRPASSQRQVSSPAVAKAASSTSKADDEPCPPSLEFMKWMRESLKSLNSLVQFEEIAQMLLSFPLDPDKATKEIIAETIYGASTTLNGHDFTEEFIKKRKEDAKERPKAFSGQSANGKPASLADIVKAQPKQLQNDFGAFKVVKKKNKRS